MKPTLELTFHDVAGSPWEGTATVRFQGEPSDRFAVREGMTGKQREDIRWYVEEYMDYPEGGAFPAPRSGDEPAPAFGLGPWPGSAAGSGNVSSPASCDRPGKQGQTSLRSTPEVL
ncbi:MAG: hypothetical protein GY856_20075 [bacterium]|nr:hypothetical protein [bacterium]